MDRDEHLAMLEAEAALLGLRLLASQAWLVGRFLADAMFSPPRYLAVAERHRALQRALLALTERLLTDARLPPVA